MPLWVIGVLTASIVVFLVIGDREISAFYRSLRHSGFVQTILLLIAIATFTIGGATIIQVIADVSSMREDRQARRIDRIERAWSRLLLRAKGNIGKGEALTTLYNEGIALTQVDLSCSQVGDWKESVDGGRCIKPALFVDVTITPRRAEPEPQGFFAWVERLALVPMGLRPDFPVHGSEAGSSSGGGIGVEGGGSSSEVESRRSPGSTLFSADDLNLSHATFRGGSITDTSVGGVDLSEAQVSSMNLAFNDFYWAKIDRATFQYVDFSFSSVSGSMAGTAIREANLSGATFTAKLAGGQAVGPDTVPTFGDGNWAWADEPPRLNVIGATEGQVTSQGVKDYRTRFLHTIALCDPKERQIYGSLKERQIYGLPKEWQIYASVAGWDESEEVAELDRRIATLRNELSAARAKPAHERGDWDVASLISGIEQAQADRSFAITRHQSGGLFPRFRQDADIFRQDADIGYVGEPCRTLALDEAVRSFPNAFAFLQEDGRQPF